MMVLVRQTEECDMMLHMEKPDMLMLVAKIEVGDKTADDVDKLACAADVVKPKQARGEDHVQLIQESSCRVSTPLGVIHVLFKHGRTVISAR
uniref:Uncharacterized protein n=1 Tax=Tanacetum cinerariifolium TaxID=118510 RepID=A0A699Q3G5_TANCI|nr:hypothetical protein [Tanacetum cinerariifolium]